MPVDSAMNIGWQTNVGSLVNLGMIDAWFQSPVGASSPIGDVSVEDFTMFGYKDSMVGRASEVHELIVDATIVRTIDGAPTLEITVADPFRKLAEMNFLSYRITTVLDKFAYELTQIKKSGDQFKLVFEEVTVAEMRRRVTPRKVAPHLMSRVEFAYLLISELPVTDFVTANVPLDVTNVELARGKATVSPGEKPEDTWKCLTRIFGDVQWRFWADMGKVFAAPDVYLIGLPSAGTLNEHTGDVDDIDYDIDAGKKVSKVIISLLSDRWTLPIGARIDIGGPGPDQGSWIVSEIRRSLFSKLTTVTAVRPQVALPEPPSQPSEADVEAWIAGVIAGKVLAGVSGPQAGGSSGGIGSVAGAGSSGQVDTAIQFAQSKIGGPYVWGGTGPTGYDCSGLVQAAFRAAGVEMPRVSLDQYNFCANAGLGLSLADAAHTRGAILEHPPHTTGPTDTGHIAISLGTGNDTIEAMGSAYGIVQGNLVGRAFTRGARVPGIAY